MTGTIVTAKPASTSAYIGRFAPSPTGPLHFGSLLAAIASYLEARTRAGRWLVRLEDIDPPREKAGAADDIIRALEGYGFEWDGPILLQSNSLANHHAAIGQLVDAGLAYPCGCSRRDLAGAPRGPLGTIYPGTCRRGCDAAEFSVRIRTSDEAISFHDALQGVQTQRLESESGDFVICRRDGLVAYHLAVVVDDALHGITDVVRGIDLMDSTPRQIWLQRLLGYPVPRYVHIPVAVNAQGQKLSKNTGAAGIPIDNPGSVLVAALSALRQNPPVDLRHSSPGQIWHWAINNWGIDRLQGQRTIDDAEIALAMAGNGLR